MIINAKQFAEKTGFPLKMIRRLCRTGIIRHWRCGRVYLFDEDKAMKTMEMLKEEPPAYSPVPTFERFGRYKKPPKGGEIRSYTEELRQLLRAKRKQERNMNSSK